VSSYHSKHKDGMIADVQQRIKNDLKDHVITQRHRDGDPGRLWRCAKPGTNNLSFTVHAPPGWLMITGDMGECMWSRHYDMLPFIRGSIGSLEYFSEKASRDCVIREKRTELAEEWVEEQESGEEWEDYHGEPMTEEDKEKIQEIREAYEEYNSVEALQNAAYESGLYDSCSYLPSCEFYSFHYLWKIEALKWFIAKLDAGEFIAKLASFEDSGNLYLLQNVAAGYVGNSPVFWCQDDSGYTPWITEAKRWTLEEAETQMKSTIGSHDWKLWPLDQVLQKAQLTVDIQQLRKE